MRETRWSRMSIVKAFLPMSLIQIKGLIRLVMICQTMNQEIVRKWSEDLFV